MSRRNTRPHHSKQPPHRHERNAERGVHRAPVVSGDFVMGRNCVQELIRHDSGRLLEVFFSEGRELGGGRTDRKQSLHEQVAALRIPVREVSRRDLESMVQSDSHQGVVARVKPRRFLELDELVEMVQERPSIRILALDGVLDPQNFGAILRAAECYRVSAVVWSKNRAAPLGPVVAKVSVGASELVPLCPVANLHMALEKLKAAGVWSVGAMVAPDAIAVESFDFPEKIVLVMGSEGEGVQHLIEKTLDFRVYISMLGEISSLNVSQASAVLLHTAANQHRQKHLLKVT
jgi:23S rRNA (guanosine2251-2'-O)-methyltransferase